MTLLGLAAAIFLSVSVARYTVGWLAEKYDDLYGWEITPDREQLLCIVIALVGVASDWVSLQDGLIAASAAVFATGLWSLMSLLRARLVALLMQRSR